MVPYYGIIITHKNLFKFMVPYHGIIIAYEFLFIPNS